MIFCLLIASPPKLFFEPAWLERYAGIQLGGRKESEGEFKKRKRGSKFILFSREHHRPPGLCHVLRRRQRCHERWLRPKLPAPTLLDMATTYHHDIICDDIYHLDIHLKCPPFWYSSCWYPKWLYPLCWYLLPIITQTLKGHHQWISLQWILYWLNYPLTVENCNPHRMLYQYKIIKSACCVQYYIETMRIPVSLLTMISFPINYDRQIVLHWLIYFHTWPSHGWRLTKVIKYCQMRTTLIALGCY